MPILDIEQNISDWNSKGYFKNNIFSSEECDQIKQELDRLRIERNSKDSSWNEYDMYSYPHKESEFILKLFGHPVIINVLENVLGDKVEAYQSMAYYKPPGELGRDIHQDTFYSRCGWGKSSNVIILLDSTDEENGCLFSYESSHFLPILPIEIDEERVKTNTSSFWKNERGKACVMPEGHHFKKVNHVCNIGDVLFIHDYIVHGSEENKSNKFRRSLVMSYKTKNSDLRQGNQMKREPFDIYEIRQKYWGV